MLQFRQWCTDKSEESIAIEKNIGELKRLRRWSRGHPFIVRAGNNSIKNFQAIFNINNVTDQNHKVKFFFTILQWLQALVTSGCDMNSWTRLSCVWRAISVCRLRPSCQNWITSSNSNGQSLVESQKSHSHISHEKPLKTPATHSTPPWKKKKSSYITQAGEQTFVWMGKFKNIVPWTSCASSFLRL